MDFSNAAAAAAAVLCTPWNCLHNMKRCLCAAMTACLTEKTVALLPRDQFRVEYYSRIQVIIIIIINHRNMVKPLQWREMSEVTVSVSVSCLPVSGSAAERVVIRVHCLFVCLSGLYCLRDCWCLQASCWLLTVCVEGLNVYRLLGKVGYRPATGSIREDKLLDDQRSSRTTAAIRRAVTMRAPGEYVDRKAMYERSDRTNWTRTCVESLAGLFSPAVIICDTSQSSLMFACLSVGNVFVPLWNVYCCVDFCSFLSRFKRECCTGIGLASNRLVEVTLWGIGNLSRVGVLSSTQGTVGLETWHEISCFDHHRNLTVGD